MPYISLFLTQTLLQIFQALFLSFDNCAHSSQSSTFQLFAAVKGITILHQPHIVFSNTVETRNKNLANSQPGRYKIEEINVPYLSIRFLAILICPKASL